MDAFLRSFFGINPKVWRTEQSDSTIGTYSEKWQKKRKKRGISGVGFAAF